MRLRQSGARAFCIDVSMLKSLTSWVRKLAANVQFWMNYPYFCHTKLPHNVMMVFHKSSVFLKKCIMLRLQQVLCNLGVCEFSLMKQVRCAVMLVLLFIELYRDYNVFIHESNVRQCAIRQHNSQMHHIQMLLCLAVDDVKKRFWECTDCFHLY